MPSVSVIIILVLAVWRLTALLVYDKITLWLREIAGVYYTDKDGVPTSFMGKLLNCFWCTSILTGGVVYLLATLDLWFILLVLAGSGGAILLNHITRIYRDAVT